MCPLEYYLFIRVKMGKTISMDAVREVESCAGKIQMLKKIVYLNFNTFFS